MTIEKNIWADIQDGVTQGLAAAELVNDNKRAVNEVIDVLNGNLPEFPQQAGDLDISTRGGQLILSRKAPNGTVVELNGGDIEELRNWSPKTLAEWLNTKYDLGLVSDPSDQPLKLRRGTTAAHNVFTGANGEVTVDTDKKTLVVHDEYTPGGNPLVDTASLADPNKGAAMVGFRGRTVYEKLSETGSLQDAGATGNGEDDDTVAVQDAIASGDVRADGGVFSVTDAVPTVPLYGAGEIVRPSGRVKLSPVPQVSVSPHIKSTQPLSAINQMGVQLVDGLLYVVNMGSYSSTQQGTLDIFDVSSANKIDKLSSLNIGAVGEIPRALSVFGGYAYVRNFSGGVVRTIDVSDPTAPAVLATNTLVPGNSEHSVFIGRTLIYTKLTGGVDFYDISNPLEPRLVSALTLPGVLHRPTVDGAGFWVTAHNDGTADNLFYVDCSDVNNPQVVSSSTLPTLKYCRFTTLQGRYLYAGGLDTTSRWNVIDVADRENPIVVYTDPSAQGATIEACGDVLIVESLLYDITNPIKPVLFGSLGPSLYKVAMYGNRAFGFGEATGPKGPSGNDSYADTYVVGVELNGIRLPAANIEHIKSKRVYAEDVYAKNGVSANAVSAGCGGVRTTGVVSSLEVVNVSGTYQNGDCQATGAAFVRGSLTTPIELFNVHTSRVVFFRLKYHLLDKNSLASVASTVFGEKIWSGYVSAGGAWTSLLPPTDVYTPLKNHLTLSLSVSVSTTGAAGSPVTISVESTELSAADAAGFFELTVSSYLPCRVERLV